ncbi:hypothetical protein [Streptomyces sp. NPDC051286]|uniref:hypothetical protein n=1 Tax=Streptomyces sp. NPDC051286 TaxID=3365647 RepID=UPI0037ABF613
MTRVIGTMGDKLLSKLLKEERAGACFPEAGRFCKCVNHVRYIITCLGPCAKSGTC